MARSCGPDVPPAENPGVRLGLAMGLAALGLHGKSGQGVGGFPRLGDANGEGVGR